MLRRRAKPSLDDLQLYCDVVDILRDSPKISFRQLPDLLGCSLSRLNGLIDWLEQHFDGPLINRATERSQRRLLPAGKELHRQATALVEQHKRIVEWRPNRRAPLVVGVTQTILLNVFTKAIEEFHAALKPDKVTLRFVEADHPELTRGVREGELDLAFGPDLPKELHRGVNVETVGARIKPVLVCHPDSDFAKLHGEEKTNVRVKEFECERVLVLPEGTEPKLKPIIVDPARGGEKLELGSYSSIVACARMKLGVGIVPGWWHYLEKQGNRLSKDDKPLQFYNLHEKEVGTIRLAVYLPVHWKKYAKTPGETMRKIVANRMTLMRNAD